MEILFDIGLSNSASFTLRSTVQHEADEKRLTFQTFLLHLDLDAVVYSFKTPPLNSIYTKTITGMNYYITLGIY